MEGEGEEEGGGASCEYLQDVCYHADAPDGENRTRESKHKEL